MGLGYCSKIVSTVYASPGLPSCRRHQKAPLGASSGSHGKESRGHASRGHFESGAAVQVGRARPAHSCALAFVDGTGAFPHSGLLFNCVTGEDKGRRAASDHRSWRSNHDGHPDFVVNFSSRACGACWLALRVHALELGKATGAQRDVSGSSAGGISDPHEGRGAGGASTSRVIPHDVLICNSPRDPDVNRAFSPCQQQRAPGGPRCTERGALAQAQAPIGFLDPEPYVSFQTSVPKSSIHSHPHAQHS